MYLKEYRKKLITQIEYKPLEQIEKNINSYCLFLSNCNNQITYKKHYLKLTDYIKYLTYLKKELQFKEKNNKLDLKEKKIFKKKFYSIINNSYRIINKHFINIKIYTNF